MSDVTVNEACPACNTENVEKLSLYVILTHACNFDCPYCFQREIHDNNPVNVENLRAFNVFLEEHRQFNHLVIMGGEAFITPEPLRELLDCCVRLNVRVGFITNGSVYLPWMVEYHRIIDTIQFTVDGYAPSHDKNRSFKDGRASYTLLMGNLRKYRADGLPVTIHGVIPINGYRKFVDGLPNLFADAPEGLRYGFECEHIFKKPELKQVLGIRAFYRMRNKLPPMMQVNVRNMRDSDGRYCGLDVCHAGANFLSYDVEGGKFYSCHETVGNPLHCIGDIKNEPVFDEDAVERAVGYCDPSRYRIKWLPRWLSELVKYVIPIHICWNESLNAKKDPYTITLTEIYRGLCAVGKPEVAIKRAGNRLIKQALAFRNKYNPCLGSCTQFCCDGCQYLGSGGCTIECIGCLLYYCHAAKKKLPLFARLRIERLEAKAYRLGFRLRSDDRWLK